MRLDFSLAIAFLQWHALGILLQADDDLPESRLSSPNPIMHDMTEIEHKNEFEDRNEANKTEFEIEYQNEVEDQACQLNFLREQTFVKKKPMAHFCDDKLLDAYS